MRGVRWSSFQPAIGGQGKSSLTTLTQAWCAGLMALSRRWRRRRSPASWRCGSAGAWSSSTPGRTSGRWRPIPEPAVRPRRLAAREDATKRLAGEIIQQAEDVAGVSAVAVVEPGPPAEVLEAVAEAEGARLIVVAARGIGPVRAAVLGSVATQLPTIAARPVVVLSEPAAVAIAQAAP